MAFLWIPQKSARVSVQENCSEHELQSGSVDVLVDAADDVAGADEIGEPGVVALDHIVDAKVPAFAEFFGARRRGLVIVVVTLVANERTKPTTHSAAADLLGQEPAGVNEAGLSGQGAGDVAANVVVVIGRFKRARAPLGHLILE